MSDCVCSRRVDYTHRFLRSAPAPVLDLLVAVRTAALRLAAPLDSGRLRSDGSRLPPLWLRRHTGPLRAVESSAREMGEFLGGAGLVKPQDTVLDIGCGAGMMAFEFERLLGPRGSYVGLDIHAPSIRWCRARFAGDSRFRFEIAAAGRRGRLPIEIGRADLILAKSVFTHLSGEEAQACLEEIERALVAGRTAVITAFLFDPAEGGSRVARYFPYSNSQGSVRWRWRARPRSAIAFGRVLFEEMIDRANLRVLEFRPGLWPGAAVPAGQDILLLAHREPRVLPASHAAPKML